jgi:hypothetical protein
MPHEYIVSAGVAYARVAARSGDALALKLRDGTQVTHGARCSRV